MVSAVFSGLKNPKQHRYGVAAAKYHRGRILADMNRIHEAIEVYREAVETRPDDYPPHSLYNLLGMTQSSICIGASLGSYIICLEALLRRKTA
jgi:tetratricopeptide (TPR) repeat protein